MEDEQSALDSANKFNNKIQADIIFEEEGESKVRESNEYQGQKKKDKYDDVDEEKGGLDRVGNDEKETEEDHEKSEIDRVEEKIIF